MNDKKSQVAAVRCASYNEDAVYSAVKAGVNALGGIEKFARAGQNVLVKPNFLGPAEASSAIVTHPAVIKAVLRILNEAGCDNVKYGDSPGRGSCMAAARKLGLGESVCGARLAPMNQEAYTEFPEGIKAKSFYFTKEAAEADSIINLCKMKTHALERITCAVKNVYGLICGAHKAAGHVKYPNAGAFAGMLADIHRARPITLNIADGITAMEGNGPAGGTPVNMNVLLFSADPVALDAAFCKLINLDPAAVPTCVQGQITGIGTDNFDNIEITEVASDTGEAKNITLEDFEKRHAYKDFKVYRENKKNLLTVMSNLLSPFTRRPVIIRNKCAECGVCVQHCPVPGKALSFKRGKTKPPVYDYKKCIRCYCCQEMCPHDAITVKGRGV